MDLLGTFRVKVASEGFKKHAQPGKLPRKWLNVDIFSKEENYELITEKKEVIKRRRSHHPMLWIPEKLSKKGNIIKAHWERNDKLGEYHTWIQTKVVEVKIHGTNILVDLENILAWKLKDKERVLTIFNNIDDSKFVTPGPTPIHKPFRNLGNEEQIKRLDYLKSFGYQENTLKVIVRGYSAKDIKKTRQKLATRDENNKRILASKEVAIKYLEEKLLKLKSRKNK
jgi:hypothetical protein